MDSGCAVSVPWCHYLLKKKNHCNEHPDAAEGNDFLCRAVVTINKLACVKCGTVHGETRSSHWLVFTTPQVIFSNP